MAKQKQMPLVKLTEDARNELERTLVDQIGKLEDREKAEKTRRGDWNKGSGKVKKDISQIAKKLREDGGLPTSEESEEDRKTAEEIAERMVLDDGEKSP